MKWLRLLIPVLYVLAWLAMAQGFMNFTAPVSSEEEALTNLGLSILGLSMTVFASSWLGWILWDWVDRLPPPKGGGENPPGYA